MLPRVKYDQVGHVQGHQVLAQRFAVLFAGTELSSRPWKSVTTTTTCPVMGAVQTARLKHSTSVSTAVSFCVRFAKFDVEMVENIHQRLVMMATTGIRMAVPPTVNSNLALNALVGP